jgi:hypothetical protein
MSVFPPLFASTKPSWRRLINKVLLQGFAVLANNIAQLLYPTPEPSLNSLVRYEKDIVELQNIIIRQRKRVIDDATKQNDLLNWKKRLLEQGPWNPISDPVSLDGVSPLPMPVKITSPDTLAPFFEHIALKGTDEKSSFR